MDFLPLKVICPVLLFEPPARSQEIQDSTWSGKLIFAMMITEGNKQKRQS